MHFFGSGLEIIHERYGIFDGKKVNVRSVGFAAGPPCHLQYQAEAYGMEIELVVNAFQCVTFFPVTFLGVLTLPFIEPRLNFIELAPKGTGKSYVFGNLSKFVWLVSGGKVSRAKLVYDKSIKAPGIMRFYDMVAFDEIQTITFSDNSEMQSFLKNYLEYGRATIDNYEFMSECGLMLLGNILLNDSNEPISHNYFETLPEVFRESALLDCFHGMIEGWLLPRVNVDMALHDWTLNVEFFSEVLHQLRTESSYSHIVDDLVEIPNGADMRHTKAVKRIATASLKLLFPHITSADQIDKSEFNALCLQPAIRRRDIVRQQCSNIDAENSFSKPMPEYKVVGL